MAPSTSTIVTVSAVAVVGSLAAYALYFDYKRRNDPDFRKRLRKEKKRVQRTKPVTLASHSRSVEELKAALEAIRAEPLPGTPEEKEQYFMDNVAMGEGLCSRGPAFELPAALSFYRALRVYPSPVELIMIYQKTVPEPVFKIVMEMTSLDVSSPDEQSKDIDEEDPIVVKQEPSIPPLEASLTSGYDSDVGKDGERTGTPSEASASSHEWDKLTDSATQSVQQPSFGPPLP